jgi:hypothetical protein
VQAILSETAVDLRSQAVDLVEIQGTIEEISRDKAIRAAEAVCLSFFCTSHDLLRVVFSILLQTKNVFAKTRT